MLTSILLRRLGGLAALVFLTACAAPLLPALPTAAAEAAEPSLAQRYVDLQASTGGRLFHIDAAASQVRVHVFRAGRAARLGHNHVLSTPQLDGWVLLPAEALEGGRFELAFRFDQLELDAPAQRAALGPAWASALSAEAVAATRSNMLGETGLQAERFPVVRLRGLQIVGAAPQLAVQVEVELHGQRQTQWLALLTELTDTALRSRGSLVLRQSDFGVTPFSVAGGLLAVQDELVVAFELVAKR